jgi:two-component system, OmpR family, sensor histidine kinase ChvG
MRLLERIRNVAASRIGRMLLAFNVLLVFLPAAGILYLDVYEERLLDAQERGMVQQARLVASAAEEVRDPAQLERMLARLERRLDARVRIYDAQGAIVADSGRLGDTQSGDARYAPRRPEGARGRILYRIGASLTASVEWVRSFRHPRPSAVPAATAGVPPEVAAALAGRYGAATRPTQGQRSLTLNSAMPVYRDGAIAGAVVVSQSTFRILQALYEIRLRIFEAVIASMSVAMLLTIAAAFRIVRPLVRLRRRAIAMAERRAIEPAPFPGADRRDEVGDLARALGELTRRLNEQIQLLESFAGDVAHEFKNPLASIRTAAELIGHSADPIERERFMTMLMKDVDRLERLVSGVRELARIDGELEHQPLEIIDLHAIVDDVVDGLRLGKQPAHRIVVRRKGPCPAFVRGSRERLMQVFENLLTNALSFAPPDQDVEVTIITADSRCHVQVADSGPGLPEGHLERVFERFFTYRPASGRRDHIGLGLPIARTIVEGYGGEISAANRREGGAVFEVRLHRSEPAPAPAAQR